MNQEVFEQLIAEFEQLNDKVIKMREFLMGENSKELDNLNRDLLIGQLKAMEAYLSILSIRIGLNAPKENSDNQNE